ncbi:hypothetical protein UPYG_G00073590 [Umbra pygmaea]|uniref:Actinodin1 n=1 Tax=Umbra pygmaea TaxID=75934 RepID=A0ABD0XC63_UMBPY
MARGRRALFSRVFAAALLATILLPEFLSAGPVIQNLKDDGDGTEKTMIATVSARRLVRNRRNISWYKQHADFWSWYKYFTDNGNQEAVQELDKVYLAYLQNKNRAEGRRSYKAYLSHLGDIYKACSDSEDPDCVASATNRPKPTPPPRPAPVKACDPYSDTLCLYAALSNVKGHYVPVPPAAPVKAPAPMYVQSPASITDPGSGYHYYSPVVKSFLSQEQKAELLRICSAEDTECLQYHLRAAFGYKPSAGPVPSYAHLGCDPRDIRCAYAAYQQAPRAPALPAPAAPGSCNPLFEDGCNPLTATKFATPPEKYKEEHRDEPAAMRTAPTAREKHSDPFAMYRDAYANGLKVVIHTLVTAKAVLPVNQLTTHMPCTGRLVVTLTTLSQCTVKPQLCTDVPPSPRQQAPAPPPQYDEPRQEERHPLGPRGKTKEGYDCFIGYDQECYPLSRAEPRSGTHRNTAYPAEPYEPHLNSDGTRRGVMEPSDPDCDPEYDTNCRLRRYEPQRDLFPDTNAQEDERRGEAEHRQEHYRQVESERDSEADSEPYQSGQEESYGAYPAPSQGLSYGSYSPPQRGMPSFQDMLRGYREQSPEQDDHREYSADYHNK